MRIPKAVQTLLLLLTSVVVVLVGSELVVRLFIPQRLVVGSRYLYEVSPTLGYTLAKNYGGVWDTVEYSTRIQTNSRGLRDHEVGKKGGKTLRILGLGDSFTFGAGVKLEDSYLKVLERALQRPPLGQSEVEVINAGVSGYGPEHHLQFLKENMSSLEPDVVTIGFYVGNDVDDRIAKNFYLEDGWLYQQRKRHGIKSLVLYPVNNVLERHSHAFVFVRTRLDTLLWRVGLRPYYVPEVFRQEYDDHMVQSWDFTSRTLQDLAALAAQHGAKLLVVIIPTDFQVYPDVWKRYSEIYDLSPESIDLSKPQTLLREFGDRFGVQVLDLLPAFKKESARKSLFFPIDGHWNEDGHRLAGEQIFEFLSTTGWVDHRSGETAGRSAGVRSRSGEPI